jgi:hypothetical protein
VHALLRHLAANGFPEAPKPLGVDGQGREMLTFVEGETVGSTLPWPAWTHTERTLAQVARWLRGYHDVVAGFIPPDEAVWRMGGQWRPGLIIGHNDAAPYNAVWRAGHLAGFIDWDMAGPASRAWDLAFVAFSWVPLHARHVVTREGFTDFGSRPARLRLLLAEYGWTGTIGEFLDIVRARICAYAAGVRALAATGDPLFTRLITQGAADDLDTALTELNEIT